MAAKHGGDEDAERLKSTAVQELARAIGIRADSWPRAGLSALQDFAVALSLVQDLVDWSEAEKQALVRVIRAKAGADESSYLKLMQKHARLRRAIIKLGS
jgi:hypothetical protein